MALPWRRHHMETFPSLLAICAGNSPVTMFFCKLFAWADYVIYLKSKIYDYRKTCTIGSTKSKNLNDYHLFL